MPRQRLTQNQLVLSGQDKLRPQRYSSYNMESGPIISRDTRLACPKKYDKLTKKAWKAIVPSLIQMQVLSVQDLPMLGVFFDAYDRYIRSQGLVDMVNETLGNDPEKVTEYLEALEKAERRRSKAFDEIYRLSARLGITPVDRTKLCSMDFGRKDEGDPLDQILGD